MRIENTSFEDYPIEFKEVNPEDFTGFYVQDKVTIKPNDKGYISDVLKPEVDLEEKSTLVINAGVGQGKTTAIIQIIKQYYDLMKEKKQQYLVFVASPFVSLVKQYCQDIEKAGIPKDKIFNYNGIGKETTISYLNKPIQVITVNTLLGNPGEDGFKNSEAKREYLNNLSKYCINNDIKVIFIYDELHDSFQNFKQEYIFNLWKWKSVILKNFVISATYNEASKIVIKYISELTDLKIKIIESERTLFPNKQSELYLHYSSANNFTVKTDEIKKVITTLVNRGKKIDVLTYSKTLAKNILNPKEEIGKMLTDKFGKLKNCTSELVLNQRTKNEEPKNQFDNTKCNVGTNFKTGVSINKTNHAFVIIFPPRATRLHFRNKYGIFSGGINSVIQALARQRTKGEIHIILPKPDEFDYTSLEGIMNTIQKQEFVKIYDSLKYCETPSKKVQYIKLKEQENFICNFYENELKGNLINEIKLVGKESSREGLPILSFPTYDEFKLEKGEDYLASTIPFFGEDISAYLTYSAITNQFVNCRLKGIFLKQELTFTEGSIKSKLLEIFDEDRLNNLKSFTNFTMFFNEIKNDIFSQFEPKLERTENNTVEDIKPNTIAAKKFELQLIQFAFNLWSLNRAENNFDYTRADYFLNSIAHTKDIDLNDLDEGSYKNKVEFYHLLNDFRNKLINSIAHNNRGSNNYYYIPSTPLEGFFTTEDISKLEKLIGCIEADKLLSDNIFSFKERFRKDTINSKLKVIYKLIIEDFFILEKEGNNPKITINGYRKNVKIVNSIKIIPNKKHSLDMVSLEDYNYKFMDDVLNSDIKKAGGIEQYNIQQKEFLSKIKFLD